MTKRKSLLGPWEMQFFAWVQFEKKEEVRTGDLVKAMNLSPKQEADLLYNLSSNGIIVKLWRGLYLVPQRLPLGGSWSPSPYLVINKYMQNVGAKFHISGQAVFNLYGYSDQVSAWFTIYNDKISKKKYFLQYHLDFTKVVSTRLGAIKKVKVYTDHEKFIWARHSSPEQTILDAVYDYKKYGTLPVAYEWIARSLKDKKIQPKKLVDVSIKYGNTISQKRIGWILDQLKVSKRIINPLQKKISDTSFLTPLNPKNRKGSINKKWNVIENVKLS